MIWVLDCYLDEAGWDGEHVQLYFKREADAQAVGKRMRARVARERSDHRLDYDVYGVMGAEFKDEQSREQYALETVNTWLWDARG